MTFNFNVKGLTPQDESGNPTFNFNINSITPIKEDTPIGPIEINYDLTGQYNSGTIQPIPSYEPTVISPSGDYNFFYVHGLPNVVKLNNWELKFCVNGWNTTGKYDIALGERGGDYISYYTINHSNISVQNDTSPYSTLIGKASSDPIPYTKTAYYVTLKYEADKGYTLITEASGSPVEYFFNNHIKPQRPELNDFTIRFKNIQIFTRSITFKSW